MFKELFEETSLKGKMIVGGIVICVGLVKGIDKWDGKLPETIMGNNGAVPFIQMNK